MPIDSPNNPVTKLLELDLEGLSREGKTRAKNEAGRIIVEEIQAHLDRSSSPVSGGRFKTRKADGSNSILLEFGDMRDAIEFKRRSGDNIEVGVFRSAERAKAFGHTTGFRGHPFLDGTAFREFIPDESDSFKRTITSRVNRAINNIKEFEESLRTEGEEATQQTLSAGAILSGLSDDLTAVSNTTAQTFALGALIPDDGGLFGEGED